MSDDSLHYNIVPGPHMMRNDTDKHQILIWRSISKNLRSHVPIHVWLQVRFTIEGSLLYMYFYCFLLQAVFWSRDATICACLPFLTSVRYCECFGI